MEEFYVKEPLYIFFYSMKEMSEFCKSVKLGGFKKKRFVRGFVEHFTLFNQRWFIRMPAIVARCPRNWSEDFMTSSNEFHAIHRFADLQSLACFRKLIVGQYFKSLANKSNSHECSFLHFFSMILKEWEFWQA